MKRLSLICVTALLGMSLAGCGNSSSHKATSSSRTNSSKVVKHHKKSSSSKKRLSSTTSQQAVGQSTTQQSNTNRQVQGKTPVGSSNDSGQDQRPNDVPANFKEYVSYTTDGHRMTQWNDAGQYEGDPDVQYQTIKAQTDAGY